MAILRITASADNTITNAFKSNLSDRGTKANMGESDILEVFSIYAQSNESSVEKSRVIVQFPTSDILAMRNSTPKLVPNASSGLYFFLRLYNARHGQTAPEKYYLDIRPIVQEWEEGHGLDMESYLNEGPSNWLTASSGQLWGVEGGSYLDSTRVSGTLPIVSKYIESPDEDLSVDITNIVEGWLTPTPAASTTQFNFLLPMPESSEIKIHDYKALTRIYKFVSSSAISSANIGKDSTGRIEICLGQNSIKFTSINKNDYTGKVVTVKDGTNTVNFTAADSGAGAVKTTATAYNWDTSTVSSANTAAVAFHAAIGLAITNSDLSATAVAPGATGTSVLINHASKSLLSLASGNDWTGIAEITTGLAGTITNFKEALTSSIGHSGSIIANQADGSSIVQLTQSVKGISGNTFLSKSIDTLPEATLTFGVDPQRYGTSTRLGERAFAGGTGLKDYGIGIFLSGSYEDGTKTRSFYTKKFFARGSQYQLKRPNIEIQWDSTRKDDRGNLITKSPHKAAADNKQVLYYYNWVNGKLVSLSSAGAVKLALTSDKTLSTKVTIEPGGAVVGVDITATEESTGIYKAEFEISSGITSSTLYEKWWVGAETDANILKGHSGNSPVEVTQWYNSSSGASSKADDRYLAKITNLKDSYSVNENVTFRVFTRNKNTSQNIVTVVSNAVKSVPLRSAYYQIKRLPDDFIVVPYSTGSVNYSGLSYDKDGSYFDLDISLLEPGYSYEASFMYNFNGTTREVDNKFKFRVD